MEIPSMKLPTIAAMALAMVLVSAGAVGGVAGSTADIAQADSPNEADTPDKTPDNRQDDEHTNESAANESDQTRNGHANETGNARAEQARDESGPLTDMPEPAPAFVSNLHEQIWVHLNGNISGAELGEALSSLTPGRETAAPAG